MDSCPGHSAYILILDGVQECLLIDSILMTTLKGKIERQGFRGAAWNNDTSFAGVMQMMQGQTSDGPNIFSRHQGSIWGLLVWQQVSLRKWSPGNNAFIFIRSTHPLCLGESSVNARALRREKEEKPTYTAQRGLERTHCGLGAVNTSIIATLLRILMWYTPVSCWQWITMQLSLYPIS